MARSVGAALFSILLFIVLPAAGAAEQAATSETDHAQVMQAFTQQSLQGGEAASISDREKRVILFTMGITLLVLLVTTAGLGIAMGIYGKQVFVAHMLAAGLSVTLAVAHSIVAIVWFFPFN